MIWDKNVLLERMMNDESIVRVLLQAFIDDAPSSLANLKGAVSSQDTVEIGNQAHAMKGMAANLAAEALREESFKVERAARDDAGLNVDILMEKLEDAFNLTMERFAEELRS